MMTTTLIVVKVRVIRCFSTKLVASNGYEARRDLLYHGVKGINRIRTYSEEYSSPVSQNANSARATPQKVITACRTDESLS